VVGEVCVLSLVSDLLLIKQERSFKQENSEKDDRIGDSEEKNEHKEDKEDIEYGDGKIEDKGGGGKNEKE
jgi:hypothetical protein